MARKLTAAQLSALLATDFSLASGKTITGVADQDPVRVTSTAHGYANGDWILITGVAGATEANGLWKVTAVAANTFDLVGLATVSTYTSGGTAKKVTVTGYLKDLKPGDLASIRDALSRVAHVRGPDSDFAGETALGTLLAGFTP